MARDVGEVPLASAVVVALGCCLVAAAVDIKFGDVVVSSGY